jgi:hemin uptake protein HemP
LKSYCFDLDGTLCTNTEAEYAQALPLPERILKVNELYDKGNRILIYTTRGTFTGIDCRDLTQKQLDTRGKKHHELRLGKPFADVYVDDRGVSDSDFFD